MIYVLRSRKLDVQVQKVVRAKSPEEARMIANRKVGSEGHIWTDSKLSTCRFIVPDGKPLDLGRGQG